MCRQITYTEGTVEDIRGTLERSAHMINYLFRVLNLGKTLRPDDMEQLSRKYERDILARIKQLETEGRHT